MMSLRSVGTGAQTIWIGLLAAVRPQTRQLGYALSSGYSSMISPISKACKTSSTKTSSTKIAPKGSPSISRRAWSVNQQLARHCRTSSISTAPPSHSAMSPPPAAQAGTNIFSIGEDGPIVRESSPGSTGTGGNHTGSGTPPHESPGLRTHPTGKTNADPRGRIGAGSIVNSLPVER